MITLTDYTSYAEVRAILGVSSDEVADATLGLGLYASALQRALRGTADVNGKSLYTLFDELSAEATPTEAEDTTLGLIKEFSAYVVAEACLSGLSLAAMKSESDGKATATRFSAEQTFQQLSNNVRSKLSSIKGELLIAIGMTITYAPVNLVNRTAPLTDPVTE